MYIIFLRFKTVVSIFLVFFSNQCFSQLDLPYKVGENFSYDISFIGLKVGEASLKIKSTENINEKSCFHIIGSGKTTPFFDIFFKVRDVYETYLDTALVLPVKFKRNINEGGFKKNQLYDFNHEDSIVYFKDSVYEIFKYSQDMLSALYFARTFDQSNLQVDDAFIIPIFMDEENYFLEIVYLERETLITSFGAIECIVFKPKMQKGRVFEDGEKMKVWISDDMNHLLVKVETQIWAGKIIANLINYTNIKHPISTD